MDKIATVREVYTCIKAYMYVYTSSYIFMFLHGLCVRSCVVKSFIISTCKTVNIILKKKHFSIFLYILYQMLNRINSLNFNPESMKKKEKNIISPRDMNLLAQKTHGRSEIHL